MIAVSYQGIGIEILQKRAIDKGETHNSFPTMSLNLLKAFVFALMIPAIFSIVCSEEFNGTTYRLGQNLAEVLQSVNASKLNLTLSQKTDNITLLDKDGRSTKMNSSYVFWRGDYIYSLDFGRHVSGNLAYTVPLQGQQFVLPLRDTRPVRIILPPGFTTGDRFLGIARPAPDEFQLVETGNVLTWWNTSEYPFIEVSYYKDDAPQSLKLFLAILAAAGIAILVEYYMSIGKLRAIRKESESKAEKTKDNKSEKK
jgi:hypothetical protein